MEDPAALWATESGARRGARAARASARPRLSAFAQRLDLAADDFLYTDGASGRRGVVAGFPWFGEWGRDTFIALPGLTLARGRVDECERVLAGALPYLRRGLLPNIFGTTTDDSHYGSADTAFWFERTLRLWSSGRRSSRSPSTPGRAPGSASGPTSTGSCTPGARN